MQSPAELEIARTLPPAGCSPAEAERYTRWLATHHYENFHVASWLLPRAPAPAFLQRLCLLPLGRRSGRRNSRSRARPRTARRVGAGTASLLRGPARRIRFSSLCAPTIRAFDIPIEPFRDLLIAFRQDQTVHRYESWDDVLGYCRYSANPVGRLVLYLCGYRDAERQRLSDATCTALQLANFWQDVSRDLDKGRIYIPLDALRRARPHADDIEARRFDERYAALMKDLIARTRELFAEGVPLAAASTPRLRVDLELFSRGGLAVLDAIEAMGYNTLEHRPVDRPVEAAFVAGARAGPARCLRSRSRRARRLRPPPPAAGWRLSKAAVAGSERRRHAPAHARSRRRRASYAECRRVARAAASNFYYAFYMLPRAKRDALCALYAFMRLVDDVSDTPESRQPRQRRKTSARRARAGALARLLDQAVAGDVSRPSDPAGFCRHHPALPHSAALFPRSDFRRGNGPDRNALRHF